MDLRLLALIFLVFTVPCSAATLLLIESYNAEYQWDASYIKGLEKALGNRHQIERFEMDTKRLPTKRFQTRAEEAYATFLSLKPDLVILADDNALRLLGKRIDASGTPVVYLGINGNPRKVGRFKNTTGVLERPLFLRSIVELKSMLGNNPKALVLFDSGTTSAASVAEAFANRTSLKVSGVTLDLKMIGWEKDWKESVLSAKSNGYTAIFIGLYHTLLDQQGNHVDADEILRWTSMHTPVPNFAFWDFGVGEDKTAGGYVLFGEAQAIQASRLIERILAGTPPGSIMPVFGERGRFLFSKSQLKRWNLKLPTHVAAQASWTD